MCLKGNKGVKMNKPKYLINIYEYLFSEDQGRYLIEVSKNKLKKVEELLNENSIHCDQLGYVIKEKIEFSEKSNISIDELKKSNKQWLKQYMVN